MSERGTTINCREFEAELAESYQDFASRVGVSTVTLRKFFRGHAPIRRTTFNRISRQLRASRARVSRRWRGGSRRRANAVAAMT